MTYQEIIQQLESLKNERGINYYKKTFGDSANYLGLGLTQLRKLAKRIRVDTKLAEKLFGSKYFEAKMLSFMIDDPKEYNLERIETLVNTFPTSYNYSPLSYFSMVFTEFITSKSSDAEKLITKWSGSNNSTQRFIAYLTLANLGRLNKSKVEFFEKFLIGIKKNIQEEENNVKDAMNNSLLYWGQRNKQINLKILESFKVIGIVEVDYGDTSCKTPNVPKILTSERVVNKLS